MHEIPQLDRKGLREFGLTTAAIIAVLFGLFFPWLLGVGYPVWPWVIFALLSLWSLLAPETLRPAYIKWMKLGILIGKVVNPVVLGLVYFLVFFPFGFVMRNFSRDPMRRKLDKDAKSYRIESPERPGSMSRPF